MILSSRAALIGICGALALPLILSGAGLSAATPPGPYAQAVRFRLLDAGGEPLAFARVSLFGTAGSAVADSEGIVALASPPRPPFRLDVFREDGEWLGAVEVADLPVAGSRTCGSLPSSAWRSR